MMSRALDRPTLEPEALERCARLRVPLFTSPTAAASATTTTAGGVTGRGRDHVSGQLSAAAGFATASFDEERVWAHYTNISGGICSGQYYCIIDTT